MSTGILAQIQEIEAEMARTQKNKATEYRASPPSRAPSRARTPAPHTARAPPHNPPTPQTSAASR